MFPMFERTERCHYTSICESYQTIIRSESWIERNLIKLRRESTQSPPSDVDYSIEGLEWRLEHLRRVKERCYSHNGRCLRFWQFRSREKEKLHPPGGREGPPSDELFEKELLESIEDNGID